MNRTKAVYWCLAICVCCAVMIAAASIWNRNRTIAQLQSLGVGVVAFNMLPPVFSWCGLNWPQVVQIVRGPDFGDDMVRIASSLGEVSAVDASGSLVTDESSRWLAKMAISHLSLSDTAVSDATVAEIARLTRLETLYIGATSITSDGLKHLRHLHRLRNLDVSKLTLTSQVVELLADMPSLEMLDISECEVPAGDLPKLASSKTLQFIYMRGLRIPEEDVQEFQRRNPSILLER